MSLPPIPKVDIVYFAGPGDVVGTFRHWLDGKDDPASPATAYSSQFFDAVANRGWNTRVISRCSKADFVANGNFRVENRPRTEGRNFLTRRLMAVVDGLGVIRECLRSLPRVIVVQEGTCPAWALVLVRLLGIRVFLDLHCALWPDGFEPSGLRRRIESSLEGLFVKLASDRILCISPAVERQVIKWSKVKPQVVLATRAAYREDCIPVASTYGVDRKPFVLFAAGRIESNKGFSDLVGAMAELEKRRPGEFACRIAGDGSDLPRLGAHVEQLGLGSSIKLLGQLRREDAYGEFARCHLVVVPTTSRFAEGLNKVCLEGALIGRPVVSTTVCNAAEVLGESNVSVAPDSPRALADAIERLATDRVEYDVRQKACADARRRILNRRLHWGNVVRETMVEFLDRPATPAFPIPHGVHLNDLVHGVRHLGSVVATAVARRHEFDGIHELKHR